jgi:hypothetical protein
MIQWRGDGREETYIGTRTNNRPNIGIILVRGRPVEVFKVHVGDGEVALHVSISIHISPTSLKPQLCFPSDQIRRRKIGVGLAYRILIAQRQVLLPIALRDLDRPVDVLNVHFVVRDVGDGSGAAATLEVLGHGGRDAGPDLDAGHVLYPVISKRVSGKKEVGRGEEVWSGGDEGKKRGVATYRSIVHGDIVHKDVLDDIDFADVLTQRTDGDTVGAVAV